VKRSEKSTSERRETKSGLNQTTNAQLRYMEHVFNRELYLWKIRIDIYLLTKVKWGFTAPNFMKLKIIHSINFHRDPR
jgi:hypothetical protein